MRTDSSEECTALAFYGLKGQSSVEHSYRIACDWFASMGFAGNMGGVKGPGFGKKLINFTRSAAKLQKNGFDGVENIELVCAAPESAFPTSNFFMGFVCTHRKDESYAIFCARSSIVPLTRMTLLPLAKQITHFLQPSYGYAFMRAASRSPTFYALGIGSGEFYPKGSKAEKENDRLFWWAGANAEKPWKDGRIRDVYPWSFLTAPQLARPVGDVTLQEWIQQDPRRGKLTAIDKKHVLWEVEERMIRPLRKPLEEAGVIYFGWSDKEG